MEKIKEEEIQIIDQHEHPRDPQRPIARRPSDPRRPPTPYPRVVIPSDEEQQQQQQRNARSVPGSSRRSIHPQRVAAQRAMETNREIVNREMRERRAENREETRARQRQRVLEEIRAETEANIQQLVAAFGGRRLTQQQIRQRDMDPEFVYAHEIGDNLMPDPWEYQPRPDEIASEEEIRELMARQRRDLEEPINCICGEERGIDMVPLACGHALCPECAQNHVRRSRRCPFCRSDVINNQ